MTKHHEREIISMWVYFYKNSITNKMTGNSPQNFISVVKKLEDHDQITERQRICSQGWWEDIYLMKRLYLTGLFFL